MVARVLQRNQQGILRSQTAPDLEKLERYTKIAPETAVLASNRAE